MGKVNKEYSLHALKMLEIMEVTEYENKTALSKMTVLTISTHVYSLEGSRTIFQRPDKI